MKRAFCLILSVLVSVQAFCLANPESEYETLLRGYARGWNSWDTRSVLNQVYLPQQFAIKLCLQDSEGNVCRDFRIGSQAPDAPILRPGDHSPDGAYSEIDLSWHGIGINVRTVSRGHDINILVTPTAALSAADIPAGSSAVNANAGPSGASLLICAEHAWDHLQRWDTIYQNEDSFRFVSMDGGTDISCDIKASSVIKTGDAYRCPLDSPVLITSDGLDRLAADSFFASAHARTFEADRQKYGDRYETFRAMRNVLAWDTIFDGGAHRVFTTVSRNWNIERATYPEYGGYVIFCWDTYFAALMASAFSRELAYINAYEITRTVDVCGFVPNYHSDHDIYTRDRSEPPVGAMCVWKIYEKYGEKWFLELLFDRLLKWNVWWAEKRQSGGLLCWGSNPYGYVSCRQYESRQGNTVAAVLESGMDNSPMYDGTEYDPESQLLDLQDVGLTSLYIVDCECLAKMADVLGRKSDARALRARAAAFSKAAQRFWCPEDGMFYNIWTKSGEFNRRHSPANFYPLLAGIPTEAQKNAIIENHLCNPAEYWGEWIVPSTPYNDPAYGDNSYWRGRIWGPLNYLVYQALQAAGEEGRMRELAEKSERLLLKGWEGNGYVFENWSSIDGRGDDVGNSDRFYSWGALLSYIALQDAGLLK